MLLYFVFWPRQYFLEHSYYDNGVLTNILDDGKMVNHSDNPNTGAGDSKDKKNIYKVPWISLLWIMEFMFWKS